MVAFWARRATEPVTAAATFNGIASVGVKLANSSYWKIPVASVVAFEERRGRGRIRADEFSRALDELDAPLE